MTDDQLAEIGRTTRLRELPVMLNDDDWNNIEPALFEFARKCIQIEKDRLAQQFAKALGWTWDNAINRQECMRHASAVFERLTQQ